MYDLGNWEPQEFGLPFEKFRECQIEAAEQILNSEARFQLLALPTGSGKSGAALLAAKAGGLRTVILTSTKGLQSQYLEVGSGCGLVDIRGAANYECRETGETCRIGPLEGCRHCASGRRSAGCEYENERLSACWKPLVSTNYSYWTAVNRKARGLEPAPSAGENPVEMLVLDEGHRAEQELSGAIQVRVRESWWKGLPRSEDLSEWQEWGAGKALEIDSSLEVAKHEYRRRKTHDWRRKVYELEELQETVEKILEMREGEWVCEMQVGGNHGREWKWDCVWPGQWAERRLFLGVPKVVIMSATLRPATAQLLGIPKDEYEFREWPRVFPPQNSPVYHIPTVRLNRHSTDEDMDKVVARIDEIIGSRAMRKGIVHTVSYARQKAILERSKYREWMMANTSETDSESAAEIVERFKAASAPAILVSPSFGTGWDFPGRDAEWQIIVKLPYPDSRPKAMQARLERSPRYLNYLCAQDLVQACGRSTRSAEDRSEVFIVDDSVTWFLKQNAGLLPEGWRVVRVGEVPRPGLRVPDGEAGKVEVAEPEEVGEIAW